MFARNIKVWLALVLVGVSVVVTFLVVESSCFRSMQIFHQAELSRMEEHVRFAYFNHSLPVVRWELEQFDELLRSTHESLAIEPRTVRFYMFTTSARLAKVCRELNDGPAYEKYLARALELGRLFEPELKDAHRLFEILEKYDQAQKHRDGIGRNETKQPTTSTGGHR
ncbi:MAG: hypothetical protein NZ739_11260 [Verrucomicrobiae bacterium]|nr:hypothetical protein [Verrucomicrobiae bacterium]